MYQGIQISASGVLTAMYRQDVIANNLANMDTVGFKPDIAATRQRPAVREEDGVWDLPSNALLERLGSGVLMDRNRVNFSQGTLQPTGNPLDLAIEGQGFFVVRDETDTSGDRLRLTRDGRMTRDAQGRLVSAGTGLAVLDAQNRPIQLPEARTIMIEPTGVIRADGAAVAQIAVVEVADPQSLRKIGHSMFAASAEAINSRTPARGRIVQSHVERSGVDEFRAIMAVTSAGREVETNIGMIQQQDRMMDRAINTLGRIS